MPKTDPIEPTSAPAHAVEPQGVLQVEDEAPKYAPRPYSDAVTPAHKATLVAAGLWQDENTPPQWDDPQAPPQVPAP